MEFTNPAPSPTLDDQTQVDPKPAGQPEHASLNQCQLIGQKLVLWAPHLVVEIRFLCNQVWLDPPIG